MQAFDCISHKLLIAKLKAYGFANNSLELISDYLSDRKQRTKIGERFSTCRDITCVHVHVHVCTCACSCVHVCMCACVHVHLCYKCMLLRN